MSTLDCPSCGESVLAGAPICPRCGHRFRHEQPFALNTPARVIGVVVVILVVLGLVTMLVGGFSWMAEQ